MARLLLAILGWAASTGELRACAWQLLEQGVAEFQAARLQNAKSLLTRALACAEASPPADREPLGAILNNLAVVLRTQGYPAKALPLARRALDEIGAAGDSRAIAIAENNLAMVIWELGDPARAEPLLRSAARRAQGEDAARCRAHLAALYLEQGRLPEAEQLSRESLPWAPAAWQSWINLAGIARVRRDFPAAEAALHRARALASSPVQYIDTLREDALRLEAMGNWRRAVAVLEQAVSAAEQLHGADSPALAPFLERQARLLGQLRLKKESRRAAARARVVRRRALL